VKKEILPEISASGRGASPRFRKGAPVLLQSCSAKGSSERRRETLMAWHPRLNTDPRHVWLREAIRSTTAALNEQSNGREDFRSDRKGATR